MKVVFLHPDLGIGGAERLVVDAAKALKTCGHSVEFVTAHHDPSHCFPETTDGTLPVTVVGNWIPRSIFGIFYAFCAYLRMIFATYWLVYFSKMAPDVVFCDQVSAPIPVLKRKNIPVIFYCHFPDQLLSSRKGWLKRVYRAPLNWWEERTTGSANVVLVNSDFTAGVFRDTFQSLKHVPLQTIYPSLMTEAFDRPLEGDLSMLQVKNAKTVFLSINRYEKKKNLALALYAFKHLMEQIKINEVKGLHLIIAGGYDLRVKENEEYFSELQTLVNELKLEDHVTFLKSPSDSEKRLLLHSCSSVIYTPENEHFGIVPIEAMYMCRPVIAANSGGPLETIVDGETGFLCDPTPASFADAMKRIANDHSLVHEMGQAGRERVKKYFSYQNFKKQLNAICESLYRNKT